MKSGNFYIVCISKIKLPKKFTKIQSSHYNYGRKYCCNKRTQNFYFNFDQSIDADKNLKHKIEFFIKSNESFAENKIKNYIEQLL